LDVRRRRLHELETERLGLSDVCRCETRVVTEEEEIGPQGIETNDRPTADGDGMSPIPINDESGTESLHQMPVDPLGDPVSTKLVEQPNAADQIAPIIELLRTRQREEREEADIRREEQALLNKRLAMMEDQVQSLSKLITQREHHNLQTSPSSSQQVEVVVDRNVEGSATPVTETEAVVIGQDVDDIIVIDEAPADDVLCESTNTPIEPVTTIEPVAIGPNTSTRNAFVEVPADVSMSNSTETLDSPSTGLGTATPIEPGEAHGHDASATGMINFGGSSDIVPEATDAASGAMDDDPATETTRTTENA